MFTDGMKESKQEVIELKDESISPDALKIVMDSIYTGDLHVNEENVFEVLAAADHLQVTSVVQQCCNFLKKEFVQLRLDLHNYCLLCTVADRHGLRDLQEAAEQRWLRRTRMFVRVKNSCPVLAQTKGREDGSCGKVIGAVRLGLVDIRVVIEELDTEEMQRVPEIHMQVYEVSLYNNMPSHNPKFAVEKTKPRSMNLILVAVLPETQMKYFEVETKTWKPLPYMAQIGEETKSCFSAEYFQVGRKNNKVCVNNYLVPGAYLLLVLIVITVA
ncbi:hypothetical protein OS493_021149 [Desmophyllum pertusum]|uniref:BTB domain-containing protein n=1 Tax=Desmophyllum pertusum TaxID=174260 RepID=A0A9W9ZNE8_9CNID|nr:hypothetical protein OS493_021149 [Desmophyllum pertusum]